jgi:hypothetical protein
VYVVLELYIAELFPITSTNEDRLSGNLVSGHFGFRIVSGQVGLVIRSSSIRLFWILNHIGLDFTIYVFDLVKSNESDPIEFLCDAYLSHVDFTLISIELNSFVFISSILNSSSSIQYKFHLKDMLNY